MGLAACSHGTTCAKWERTAGPGSLQKRVWASVLSWRVGRGRRECSREERMGAKVQTQESTGRVERTAWGAFLTTHLFNLCAALARLGTNEPPEPFVGRVEAENGPRELLLQQSSHAGSWPAWLLA